MRSTYSKQRLYLPAKSMILQQLKQTLTPILLHSHQRSLTIACPVLHPYLTQMFRFYRHATLEPAGPPSILFTQLIPSKYTTTISGNTSS
ncbi:hypothetical protein M758_3G196300 [Ceratodon purpureus]|uniref:Uncharacterized protein n=1 Tax=Ceratodon purpureus TaxID=3225 RepID=A0A8T0INV4_CERPU|nr:hypothetical protein KC19_3G197200 [Ceratodon purpureus]KAG0623721.1 hypothetical protein M758_3G196300 [Ceratodon purpureus]